MKRQTSRKTGSGFFPCCRACSRWNTVFMHPNVKSKIEQYNSNAKRTYLKILQAVDNLSKSEPTSFIKGLPVAVLKHSYDRTLADENLYSYKVTPNVRLVFSASNKDHAFRILDLVDYKA